MSTNPILESEKISHRPCCSMLKKYSQAAKLLNDPVACTELLACMEKHCVLMKRVGRDHLRLDEEYGQCYLLVDPVSTRQILDALSETITLSGLTDFYEVLNKIETSIAKSPLLKEVAENYTLLLKTIREGQKKFGAVPFTIERSAVQSPELLDQRQFLMDHPRLQSPQFDGVPPSQSPLPNNNPSSAEQVNRLQLQHMPKPAFNPRPQQP